MVHGVYQERGAFITRYLWVREKLIDTGHFLESGRLLDLRISPGLYELEVLLSLRGSGEGGSGKMTSI